MKSVKHRLWWGLIGLVIIVVIVWAFVPKAVEVDVATVGRGPLQVTVDHEGKTRIKERYVVSAPLGGWMQRIPWKAGATVEAGKTLLGVIEPSDPTLLDARTVAQAEARVKAAEAAKAQSSANLERARAAEELASSDLQRATQLLAQGATSQREFDAAREQARAATESAKAAQYALQIAAFELEQAKAALLRVRPGPADAQQTSAFEIVSPVSGRVLRVLQESATAVMPGQPLLEVGDPANLEIVVDVLSSDAVKVRPGAKMLLEHWGGPKPLVARVRLVEPAGFLKVSALGVEEQRVNVIGDFVDPPEQWSALGDAFRVEARIIVWEGQDILRVPSSALFRSDDGWAVFRVVRGRARVCPVRIGHSNGLESEVLEGLDEGDRVIVHPGDKVKTGVRVTSR
jgi:HlyD family secretion protein